MVFIFYAQNRVNYQKSDLVLSYVLLSADVITTILKVHIHLLLTEYPLREKYQLGPAGSGCPAQ